MEARHGILVLGFEFRGFAVGGGGWGELGGLSACLCSSWPP